ETRPLEDSGLPNEHGQLLTILRCVSDAEWSWGRVSLVRILRGDDKDRPGRQPLHEKARENAGFGALAFRSQTAVERMLNRLESGGFLQARQLHHGGGVLDITPAGQEALQDPIALDSLVAPVEKPPPPHKPPKESAKRDAAGLDVDDALFQALRAWRLEQARARKVAPYVVFHNSHLRAIAAHRPVTLEALSELKGVGPRKLEQYGAVVIELVREHLAREA
ncbi:MAG: HRDC domain-containing protein, partial [Chloroflexota bacterium]|nr:HRDC domain-containing protein [Chloroflexota bacterium]